MCLIYSDSLNVINLIFFWHVWICMHSLLLTIFILFYHNVWFSCVELKKIPPKFIKKNHSCWHGKKKEKSNFLFHSLQFFLNDFNKSPLRRSKTAVLISIFIIYWNLKKKKNQLASETLPGQQEGQKAETSRRETAFWWGAPSGLHVRTPKLLGSKQTPEPAEEADGTLSDILLPEVLRSPWTEVPASSRNSARTEVEQRLSDQLTQMGSN